MLLALWLIWPVQVPNLLQSIIILRRIHLPLVPHFFSASPKQCNTIFFSASALLC
jgi:hypothetical protein